MLVINKDDLRGLSIAAAQKAVTRLREGSLEGVYLHLQLGAPETIARVADAHITACLHQIVWLKVFDPIGAQRGLAATQFGIALNGGVKIGTAGDHLAKDKGRHLIAWAFWRFFTQLRRDFQRRAQLASHQTDGPSLGVQRRTQHET